MRKTWPPRRPSVIEERIVTRRVQSALLERICSRRTAALGLVFGVVPLLAGVDRAFGAETEGRPEFHIDRLTFPPGIAREAELRRQLERALKLSAKKVDFGTGRGGRVEARFALTTLSYKLDGSVLSVEGALTGRLPSGRHAESTIRFGGRPSDEPKLTKQVLEILARGVVTRLADLERRRRGL